LDSVEEEAQWTTSSAWTTLRDKASTRLNLQSDMQYSSVYQKRLTNPGSEASFSKCIILNIFLLLSNLLRNRTFHIRIGKTAIEDFDLKIGVPQGSPLIHLLFSVMMDDYPVLSGQGETLLFLNEIGSHELGQH
jgi:hypothetical protein